MGLSQKQKQILTFPRTRYTALICDGAVRSGKTSIMALSFILWLMKSFNGYNFAIAGKSVQSAARNVIQPLMGLQYFRENGFRLIYSASNHRLTVSRGQVTNTVYVFGGKDESSYTLIQGVTLAGVMLDEVALMPRSFVEQALARCSVAGSRFWFNCNPENPNHWFYKEWIEDLEHKKSKLYLHFLMEDNPSLTQEILERYRSMYSGVFFDRYILGKWVKAEGLIYPMFSRDFHVKPTEARPYEKYYISCDYGTLNPTSAGLWGLADKKWYRVAEYYYSGRETQLPRTDEEHYAALEELAGDRRISSVVVDPSAASFRECIKRHGKFRVEDAINDVLNGIRNVATHLKAGDLLFDKCCESCIKEFGLYVWDEKSTEDKPVKENDHAMDDARYFVSTVLEGKHKARIVNNPLLRR